MPFVTSSGRDHHPAVVPIPGNLLFSSEKTVNKQLFSMVEASPCHGDGDGSFHGDLVPGTSFRHTHAAGVSSSGIRSISSGLSLTEG